MISVDRHATITTKPDKTTAMTLKLHHISVQILPQTVNDFSDMQYLHSNKKKRLVLTHLVFLHCPNRKYQTKHNQKQTCTKHWIEIRSRSKCRLPKKEKPNTTTICYQPNRKTVNKILPIRQYQSKHWIPNCELYHHIHSVKTQKTKQQRGCCCLPS